MGYRALPTVADGDLLSAQWLNQLSDNVEHLYGFATTVNMPFYIGPNWDNNGITIDDGVTFATYYMRHRERYLHFQFFKDGNTITSINFYLDGTDVRTYVTGTNLGTDSNPGGQTTYTGYFDTDANPPNLGLADLGWYKIEVKANWSGTDRIYVDYLFESESTTA